MTGRENHGKAKEVAEARVMIFVHEGEVTFSASAHLMRNIIHSKFTAEANNP
jgi:hypothetical protein